MQKGALAGVFRKGSSSVSERPICAYRINVNAALEVEVQPNSR